MKFGGLCQHGEHLFWVHFIEMSLEEQDAGVPISSVELVRNVPTKRTKLTPLLHRTERVATLDLILGRRKNAK